MAKKDETVLKTEEVTAPEMIENAESETKVAKPKATKSDKAKVIYVGPNNMKLGLTRSTVYIDGLPAVVEQNKETYPLLYLLFVPIDCIEDAEKDLATEGSALSAAYYSVKGGLTSGL